MCRKLLVLRIRKKKLNQNRLRFEERRIPSNFQLLPIAFHIKPASSSYVKPPHTLSLI